MRITRRLAAAIRAVAALALLASLTAGLPVVLGRAAGWPLPTSAPTWLEVRAALTGSTIDDSTIVKIVALVGWVAWLQLVTALVVEVVAWARGGMPRTLPFTGPIQPLVRQLVLAALVVSTSTRHVPAPPITLPAAALAVAAHPAEPPLDRQAGDTPELVPAAGPTTPTYVVKPRDSLWRIAETCLGDGLRWRELWDLNRNAPQPDGRSLTNPDLIRPGWTLRLPADATHVAGTPPTPTSTPEAPTVTASPPSTDSSPAAAHPPTEPNATTNTLAERPSADRSGPSTPESGEDQPGTPTPAPVGVAGLAVIAAGIVATLTKLRRAQVRRRTPGYTVPLPDATVAVVENTLRSVADLARTERIELAVRALSNFIATSGSSAIPALEAMLAGSDIEFLFDEPLQADAGPFTVTAGGRAWTLPGSTDPARLESAGDQGITLFPALVSIGRIDDRDLFIDLEASTLIGVKGPDEEVDALFWSMVASLATSCWSDDARVVVLGDLMRGLDQLAGVERIDGDAGIEALALDLSATSAELESQGWSTTRAARAAGGSWSPVIVFARSEADAEAATTLAGNVPGPAGLVVVAAGQHSQADRRLLVDGSGTVTVDPPGIRAALPQLPEGFTDAVEDLLAVAGTAESTEPVIDLRDEAQDNQDPQPLNTRLATAPSERHLVVRTLGPIEIDGGRNIDRRQSEELVVYLSLHPDGADEQTIRTALWPESAPSQHTFNQVVSRARVCLGTDPAGEHYLPRLDGGRYRLSDYVTTDGDLLAAPLAAAQRSPDQEAIEGLAAALRLVRGQPFQAVKAGYEWAHSEGFATRLEILAADAAHHLAAWYLEQGEPTPALWAAEQGLLASPLDEALFRDRMRAYAAAGNHAAVEAVMRELCRAVDALEPYDSLHPETVELYNQLTRRRVG